MQTIKAIIGHADTTAHGDATWEEEWSNIPDGDPQKRAADVVEYYNKTLTHGDRPRRLVRVIGATTSTDHVWERTNLVTIADGSNVYDTLRCRRCGVTSKRYGVEHVVIDRQFRANKYKTCEWHKPEPSPKPERDDDGIPD